MLETSIYFLLLIQCIVNENFCVKPSLRPYLDPLRGKKFSLITKGAFHVVPKFKLEKGKGMFPLLEFIYIN